MLISGRAKNFSSVLRREYQIEELSSVMIASGHQDRVSLKRLSQTIKLPERVLQQRVAGIRTWHISDPLDVLRLAARRHESCWRGLGREDTNIMNVTLTFGVREKDGEHSQCLTAFFTMALGAIFEEAWAAAPYLIG